MIRLLKLQVNQVWNHFLFNIKRYTAFRYSTYKDHFYRQSRQAVFSWKYWSNHFYERQKGIFEKTIFKLQDYPTSFIRKQAKYLSFQILSHLKYGPTHFRSLRNIAYSQEMPRYRSIINFWKKLIQICFKYDGF